MSHLQLQGLNLLARGLEGRLDALSPALGGWQAVTGRLVLAVQELEPETKRRMSTLKSYEFPAMFSLVSSASTCPRSSWYCPRGALSSCWGWAPRCQSPPQPSAPLCSALCKLQIWGEICESFLFALPALLAHPLILLQLVRRLFDLGLEGGHDAACGPGHSENCQRRVWKLKRKWSCCIWGVVHCLQRLFKDKSKMNNHKG